MGDNGYNGFAEMAAESNANVVREQQQELRRLERIESAAMHVMAWRPSHIPEHAFAALKVALGNRTLPYPFCSRPEKCAGKGSCQAEFCCND